MKRTNSPDRTGSKQEEAGSEERVAKTEESTIEAENNSTYWFSWRKLLRHLERIATIGAVLAVLGVVFDVGEFKGKIETQTKHLDGQINALQGRQSDAEKSGSGLNGRLSTLEGRRDALEGMIEQLKAAVHQLDASRSKDLSRMTEAFNELDIRVAGTECSIQKGTFNFRDNTCTVPNGRSWRHRPKM
ncbi:MAG: hypothetical protein GY835_18555 [bacterium]|nr:hypothetical protein [bacterium]